MINPVDMQIVKWPTVFYDEHYDTGDKYGVLLYLNDNFKGGETIIDKKRLNQKGM